MNGAGVRSSLPVYHLRREPRGRRWAVRSPASPPAWNSPRRTSSATWTVGNRPVDDHHLARRTGRGVYQIGRPGRLHLQDAHQEWSSSRTRTRAPGSTSRSSQHRGPRTATSPTPPSSERATGAVAAGPSARDGQLGRCGSSRQTSARAVGVRHSDQGPRQPAGDIKAPRSASRRCSNTAENDVRCAHPETAEEMRDLADEVPAGGQLHRRVHLLPECQGVPRGLGAPRFDQVPARLGQAMFAIPAVTAFEFGLGRKPGRCRARPERGLGVR